MNAATVGEASFAHQGGSKLAALQNLFARIKKRRERFDNT
jgi:hypothetical protein